MKNQIDPNWVSWAEQQVRLIKDGGYIIFPSDGAIFQVNKSSKTLSLICCVPTWIGSKTEITNRQVFAKINYRYVKPDEIPTTPDAIVDSIFANLQKYASDIPTLLHGIGIIFGLKEESDDNDNRILSLISKKGKKLPINPVTIRGEGNFTAGRLWIGVENASVPDTSHRFNPSVKRGQSWEKPVTIILWRAGQAVDAADPNRPAMIVDESDFIQFVDSLKGSLDAQVKLWGQANRVNEHQKMYALFDRQKSRLEVRLYKTNDDFTENALVGEAILDSDKFFDGLGHLFPNGELS